MYATMDIGTNSCRLLVAQHQENQGLHVLERQLRITRIGEGMSPARPFISQAALERTLNALEEFSRIIAGYPVEHQFLVATQAVRMAENKAELLKAVRKRLGWDVRIISGEEEAWLSYLGAVTSLGEEKQPLVIDIGGGSTEFIHKAGPGKVEARSIPWGALKLLENPRTDQELAQIIAEDLAGFFAIFQAEGQVLVGVGGTCTTLAAIALELSPYDPDKVQGSKVRRDKVEEIYQRLSQMPVQQRLAVPGLYPGREDIIVPGIQLLRAVLDYFRCPVLTVSDQDLLYGLIYDRQGSSKV